MVLSQKVYYKTLLFALKLLNYYINLIKIVGTILIYVPYQQIEPAILFHESIYKYFRTLGQFTKHL